MNLAINLISIGNINTTNNISNILFQYCINWKNFAVGQIISKYCHKVFRVLPYGYIQRNIQ